LQKSQSDLLRKQAFQDTVLKVVTHDITSPMRFLNMLSSRLRKRWNELPEKDIMQDLEALEASSIEASNIGQNLLNWLKTEKSGTLFEKKLFSPYELVERNLSTYRWMAGEKGIKLQFIPPHQHTPVYVYEELVSTIVRNLLDNAIKYTRKGYVTIKTELHDSILEIIVSDTGDGMTTEQVDMLNNGESPFELEQSRHLGFRLIFDILNHIHARLKVESTVGRGSTFVVQIPT
jgi:signal transduction histidine kinase